MNGFSQPDFEIGSFCRKDLRYRALSIDHNCNRDLPRLLCVFIDDPMTLGDRIESDLR